uniref:LysM domain-containing protein n=1 Tax=Cannabis sativa TaxID=3483 RepID=A0A803NY25_CANSA
MADAKLFGSVFGSKGKTKQLRTPKVDCNQVYGIGQGDTCFAVAQFFGLATQTFNSLNPNLNCTTLFVGQWLCVSGTAK